MSEYRDPERRDRPSTSKFSDYEKCKAKYRFELLAPSEIEPNEWAAYGNEVHVAWSPVPEKHLKELQKGSGLIGECDDVSEEISAVLKTADAQLEGLIEEISETVKARPEMMYPEHRLWYPDDLYSGRPDRVYTFEDKDRTALIPDLKSLWGPVEPPAVNWQLRGSVPLVKHAFGSKRAVTAILQPNREWMPPAFYDPKRIEEAEKAALQLVAEIDVDDPVPTPGEHCGRCNARLWCKAALSLPQSTALVTQHPNHLIPLLDDRTLQRVFFYGKAAEKITREAGRELKKRLKDEGDESFDYRLRPTGSITELGNLQTIFTELRDMLGIDNEGEEFDKFLADFQSGLSLSLPHVTKIMAVRTGMTEESTRETIEKRLTLRGLLISRPKEMALVAKHKWEVE